MKLVVLDPGHFHAALMQKSMHPAIEASVHVYAPPGPDVEGYLRTIESYNARAQDPTHWRVETVIGPDFLERFTTEKRGDVAVIAGNNRRKTAYLTQAVAAGFHTLADKPMAIDAAGFDALGRAFALARRNGVLLYDIMTERYEIATMLQREFAGIAEVFGELERGTPDAPAVILESVHHFAKLVSGAPVKRPGWFFDPAQQGDGLVDVMTHLVDLVQWACLPGVVLDHARDIGIGAVRRWPTVMTPAQFARVTQFDRYPDYLGKDVQADGRLNVYANGEINYVLRGVHAKVSALWNFEAPAGAGDTHHAVLRGSKASLVIRQGIAESHVPTLYIEPVPAAGAPAAGALERALTQVEHKYPGVRLQPSGNAWRVFVPASYHVGHEAHFGQVIETFLACVKEGALPPWEEPNMMAKYFTTTHALTRALAAS